MNALEALGIMAVEKSIIQIRNGLCVNSAGFRACFHARVMVGRV